MKQGIRIRTVILLWLLLSGISGMYAQSCLPEGITFATQAQIDSFQINYPGCDEIEGKVSLGGNNISSLNGLNVITAIGGNLWISNSISLKSLEGLNNLISVGGDISIGGMDSLLNLEGIDNLSTIDGMLEIAFNHGLISLSGINSLAYIGSRLKITYNPALKSLSGLENLLSIDEDILIYNNTELLELTTFTNSISIGGTILIADNPSLNSLSGLQNVISIEGSINIENNDALQSLSGIDNIEAASIMNLNITFNPQLSTCEVLSVCNYLVSPNGTVEIHNNNVGCNSQAEVETACEGIGIPEQRSDLQLSTFPNPFTTSTTIEYELTEPTHVHLTIYNTIGETIYVAQEGIKQQGKHSFTWSPERLPEGMYYGVLRSEKGVSVLKAIKQ